MSADLHVHSTASDGNLTPREIVIKAYSRDLSTIALTDHDTVSGVDEARIAGNRYNIQVVPGIEVSSTYRSAEVHVLGYFIDPNSEALSVLLKRWRQQRHKRTLEIIAKLKSIGLALDLTQVQRYVKGDVVGRPHIARAMVGLGYVKSVQDAFSMYLQKDKPAYVPRFYVSPKEAIEIIRQSGGVAVMAHPGLIPKHYLGELLELKWQGIEVFHPEHDQETICYLQKAAIEYDLIPTAGSDFHGDGRKERTLGIHRVSDDIVKSLKSMCGF